VNLADSGRPARKRDDPVVGLALRLKIEGMHKGIVRSRSGRRKLWVIPGAT
jgi:hypothetical protein